MSNADFWARQLGGQQAPPPHIQQPAAPAPGAWWAPTPASSHLQVPPQAYQGQGQGVTPGEVERYTYDELKRMRADEMSQDQMEQLAEFELQSDKYNHVCPQCGSNNFLPKGTRVNTGTTIRPLGADKCFECGASSSTLTGSPEPAVGVTGNRAASLHTRQTANGGAASGNYGRHYSEIPQNYLPRNV